jgi:endonuclease/exonuclease/phosphatase family metal-dependent hydrolase
MIRTTGFRRIASSALLLAALVPAQANALLGVIRPQEERTATVMTWNLGGFTPIAPGNIKNIARVIVEIKPDVIAVQEMTPADNFRVLRDELVALNHDYRAKYLTTVPKPDGGTRANNRQMLGILYLPHAKVERLRTISGSEAGNPNLRHAQIAWVKVHEFDFHLVNVHLKAGRRPADRDIRNVQTRAIRETLVRLLRTGAEKDVLLVGDYNMIPIQDRVNFETLQMRNTPLAFLSDSFIGQGSHLKANGEGGSLLDGYAITRDATVEYIPGSERLHPAHRMFGWAPPWYVQNVSDHLPLSARFRAEEDDD